MGEFEFDQKKHTKQAKQAKGEKVPVDLIVGFSFQDFVFCRHWAPFSFIVKLAYIHMEGKIKIPSRDLALHATWIPRRGLFVNLEGHHTLGALCEKLLVHLIFEYLLKI